MGDDLREHGVDLARELEAWAGSRGFVAPQAYYIVGGINLTASDGSSIYTDEAHLWCKGCAEALLSKAATLPPASRLDDHLVCPTDAAGEDTCPHCAACGETLSGSVSSYCVGEEVDHYAAHPIDPGDEINPRQAVEIAMILRAAPDDKEVIAIGRAALAAAAKKVNSNA